VAATSQRPGVQLIFIRAPAARTVHPINGWRAWIYHPGNDQAPINNIRAPRPLVMNPWTNENLYSLSQVAQQNTCVIEEKK